MTICLVTQEQRQEIAGRIRAEMGRKGFNSARLARSAGLSDKTISRLLHAKLDPRYSTVERVAEALGITEEELRGRPEPLGLIPASADLLFAKLAAIEAELKELRGDMLASAAEVLARIDAGSPPNAQTPRRRPA